MKSLVAILVVLFMFTTVNGATILVPLDQPTIQAGVNATADDDTVLVASGTYTGSGNRDIEIDKRIVVMSEEGPDSTIIDCQNVDGGFVFIDVGNSTELVGFTIKNAPSSKRAIDCDESGPSIINCVITENSGGGLNFYWATSGDYPYIINCEISNNSASNGAGILLSGNGRLEIENSAIFGNHATQNGGGVKCWSTHRCFFTNCEVWGNTAGNDGGAIYGEYSTGGFAECSVYDNSADNNGGAIYDYFYSPNIQNCELYNNSAKNGGFLYSQECLPYLRYNSIHGNSAVDKGGAVYVIKDHGGLILQTKSSVYWANTARLGGAIYTETSNSDASPLIVNCTFSQNTGKALYCAGQSKPTVLNCILWDNEGEIYGSPQVTYSDVEGGWTGEGNIDEDPLFVDPWNGDLHLQYWSPCIDRGDSTGVTPEEDFERNPRFDHLYFENDPTVVDMGADEYCPHGLNIIIPYYWEWVVPGAKLWWKVVISNDGEWDTEYDKLRLDVAGPMTASVRLWSGSVTLMPGEQAVHWFNVRAPMSAPIGIYSLTTVVEFDGQDQILAGFDCEVVE